MRCPKCSYFFSEELKYCPRCGADVGEELEKLGFFPPSAEEPFLTIEDFIETPAFKEKTPFNQERIIEIPLEE